MTEVYNTSLAKAQRVLRSFNLEHVDSDWVQQCVEYCIQNSQLNFVNEFKRQLLAADFEDILQSLNPNYQDSHLLTLSNNVGFCFQIQNISEIGLSSQSLLEQLKSKEPLGRKMLKLTLNDGSQTLIGLEVEKLNGIDIYTPLGLKVLINNVTIRRGVVLLKPINFRVIGGLVQHLNELPPEVRLERELSQKLGLDSNTSNNNAAMNFQNEQHHIEDVLNPTTVATPIHRNTPQPTANTNMYRNTINEVLGNSSKPNVPMQTPKPSLAERLKTPNQIPLILSNSKTQSSSTIHMETPVKSDLGKIQLIPQNLTETPQPSSSVKMSLHERLKNSTSFAQRLNKINPAVSSQTSVSGTPLPTTAKSNANEINPLENKNEKQDEIIIIPSSPLLECNPIKLEQVMIQDNFDDFDEDFEKGLESINVDNLVVASQLSAQAKVEDRLETNKHSVIKQSTPNPNHNYSAKVEMSNMKSVDLNGLSEINNCEFDEFGMDEMEIIQPNKSDKSLSQSEKFSSQNTKNINLKPMRQTGKRYNEILSSSPPSNSIKMSKKQKVHVKDTSSNAESMGNLELVSFVDIMQYDGMVQLKGKVKQLKSKLKSDKGVGFWLMVELIDNDQNTLTIKFEDEYISEQLQMTDQEFSSKIKQSGTSEISKAVTKLISHICKLNGYFTINCSNTPPTFKSFHTSR